MNRNLMTSFVFAALVAGSAWAAPAPGGATKNLCYNGAFDLTEPPLAGWTYDYQWEGNSHYMQNHTRVSLLASHSGRENVMFINGASAETKAESKPIPYTVGARYRCTLEVAGKMPHIYFRGYKWNPGVRPHDDPHIGDLRNIYKSQFRNHKTTPAGGGWNKVSFEFPLENPSALAQKSLKYLRFFTIYAVIVDTGKGQAYIDNVQVERIQ